MKNGAYRKSHLCECNTAADLSPHLRQVTIKSLQWKIFINRGCGPITCKQTRFKWKKQHQLDANGFFQWKTFNIA